MGILDTFDPKRDGWSWENLGTPLLTWDQYRRTYLGISSSPTAAAPMDLAFYEIFKGCAAGGNCGGMAVLALTIFKYGGYLGWGSPAIFYKGGSNVVGPIGPARPELLDAINIMQARQFSAPGIRNFVDVVKAGQLNDGLAAFDRIRDGLGSGDYHVISLANGLFGTAAHTLIPYRAEQVGGTRTLWLWDPNHPYDDYPEFYDEGLNRLVITGPTSWVYDQNYTSSAGIVRSGGTRYDGSLGGWCFAIPTSAIRHKAHQPSLAFAITNATLLFVSGTGSVAQIEDDEGRHLFTDAGVHARRGDLETSPERRLEGVVPFPWNGAGHGGTDGEVYVLARPADAPPLTVTVRGADYRLQHLAADRLTEVTPQGRAKATDSVRLEGPEVGSAVEVRTSATRRRFDVRHVRVTGADEWRGVQVRNALVTDDAVRVRVPDDVEAVDVSGSKAGREVDLEFQRFRRNRLSASTVPAQRLSSDGALRAAAEAWTAVPKARQGDLPV